MTAHVLAVMQPEILLPDLSLFT